MTAVAWNCRGLGSAPKIRALKTLVNKYNPSLVFLSETKVATPYCEKVAKKCGFKKLACVDAIGTAGGLCLMWNEELRVCILHQSLNIIHVKVEHPIMPCSWILSCIYGPPYTSLKERFWNELGNMSEQIKEPWLLLGDFNETLHDIDRFGGKSHASHSKPILRGIHAKKWINRPRLSRK